MKKSITAYQCGNCGVGEVTLIERDIKGGCVLEVKKCDACKHQYYIMQLMKSDLKILRFEIK